MPYASAEDRRAYTAAAHANARAEEYGAPGRITMSEARAIYAAERCYYCGATRPRPYWAIDHVVPLHAGGVNRPENIRLTCHRCNASKGRADKPGRWSQRYRACRRCRTTTRAHAGRGLCSRCRAAVSRARKSG